MTDYKPYRSKWHRKRQIVSLKREFDDLVRGVCGGFLFGIPVLYTMEVWWIGSSAAPSRLLGVLLTTLLGTYLLSSTAGFRKSKAMTRREAFGDAVEAIALGLICAALMLTVMRQITLDTQLSEAVGKTIFESVPFSLGVALANQFLRSPDDDSSDSENPPQAPQKSEKFFPENNLNETISDTSATLLGSVVVAFSISPTDEVTVLVSAIHGPWLMAIVLISLVLSYSIVFQANFTRQGQRRLQEGLFQGPLSETVFSYLLSLLVAGAMLIFFQKLDLTAPLEIAFRQVLILGLPATIGGAAGRLVL
ncbi:MAG: TIGR02587 family membrane protein [Leptolyngbya foveolarum]|uniref:TIGR02587 family membrane protein n=1 Tax=Leptolyngbya foveolarum TaxID=47253 RepID=A0A2W4U2J8_9CYAN|nr:MAG: TIGR02587 family membrane protein [Leptolyngbya foveolarum]